ncbi:hypothetical protein [Corynebacterium aquatimens]|uniref:Secreted protein n=1 Tax=Corynebacterium aquatimens TaxID=1190508 RepID=A0A931DW53_9CORY|nr:hypothetical protein [Corynebacterium aquatimens]MBG6121205.1 hypothetical protein [Corynebacterium aquatimens]WJY66242.1 hypothetical protein CAQUA_07730 [Corynebacterium aquatimens]
MSTQITRSVAVAAVAAASLAIAACSPPNEQPSDKKVDTATEQNPDSLPGNGVSATATTNPNITEVASSEAAEKDAELSQANTPDGAPRFKDCNGDLKSRPNRIQLDCKNQDDVLTDIVWDSWGPDTAEGTGVRKTSTPDREPEENIRVILSLPVNSDGELVFDSISVDGQTINPDTNY